MQRQLVDLTTTAAARILSGVSPGDAEAGDDALAIIIAEAVRDGDAVRIRVHGPQSLFEA
jgi:hypothetical protein